MSSSSPHQFDSFLEHLHPHGAPVQVDQLHRLALPSTEQVWLVEAGQVDVFFIPNPSDGVQRNRQYLFTCRPGDLLFSISDRQGAGRLLLMGQRAGLLSVPLSVLWSHVARSPEAAVVHLERWVLRLTQSLAASPPPSPAKSGDPETRLELAKDESVSSASDLCWGHLSEGTLNPLGLAQLLVEAPAYLPLTEQFWAQAGVDQTRLQLLGTETLNRREAFPEALETFHDVVLETLTFQVKAEAEAEEQRLRNQVLLENQSLGHSLEALRSILTDAELPELLEDVDDPLLAACRLIGREIDVEIVPPHGHAMSRDRHHPVLAIAQASRIQVRQVALRKRWWEKDHGPLLGMTDDQRPVALIQRSPTEYDVHDPAARTVKPLTQAAAARLQPMGYAFIPPFPDEVLTPRSILRFAAHGLKRDFATMAMAGLFVGLLGLVVPIFSQILFDKVIPLADRTHLLEISLLFLALVLVTGVFELVRGIALLRLEGQAEMRIEMAVIDRLLRLPLSFYKRYLAGDLANRALGISQMRQALTASTLNAVLTGVFASVNLILLFFYDVMLALIGLALTIIAVVVTVLAGRLKLRYNRVMQEESGNVAGLLIQLLNGMTKLRVAGAEQRAFSRWAFGFARQKAMAFKAKTTENSYEVFKSAFPLFTSIVFFLAVALLMVQGPGASVALSTGTFVAIITAFAQLLMGVLGLGMALITILEVTPLYERATPIFEALPERVVDAQDPGVLTGSIEVSHVNFRYHEDAPLVLHDISIRVEPGEMVALVGPSGSGKSTLLRLLLGFETPESGSIYYDALDMTTLDLESVRNQIGTVLQSDVVMPGSIVSNILGGLSTLNIDDAWEAARLAGIEDDIKDMPMGMYTVISEGGTAFSGGQRQRLMIARAIADRPRTLFFDEATSALDNATQQAVTESLDQLQVTRIVVAHRLSTIRNADRIYVLEAGHLVESGSYASLMAQDGPFARLARRQLVEADF